MNIKYKVVTSLLCVVIDMLFMKAIKQECSFVKNYTPIFFVLCKIRPVFTVVREEMC